MSAGDRRTKCINGRIRKSEKRGEKGTSDKQLHGSQEGREFQEES